ncbi:hypothetical protein NL676_020098 [Syzygium grande]|nr:hypothetical protein NL676_020098 [Syzygium grande]
MSCPSEGSSISAASGETLDCDDHRHEAKNRLNMSEKIAEPEPTAYRHLANQKISIDDDDNGGVRSTDLDLKLFNQGVPSNAKKSDESETEEKCNVPKARVLRATFASESSLPRRLWGGIRTRTSKSGRSPNSARGWKLTCSGFTRTCHTITRVYRFGGLRQSCSINPNSRPPFDRMRVESLQAYGGASGGASGLGEPPPPPPPPPAFDGSASSQAHQAQVDVCHDDNKSMKKEGDHPEEEVLQSDDSDPSGIDLTLKL